MDVPEFSVAVDSARDPAGRTGLITFTCHVSLVKSGSICETNEIDGRLQRLWLLYQSFISTEECGVHALNFVVTHLFFVVTHLFFDIAQISLLNSTRLPLRGYLIRSEFGNHKETGERHRTSRILRFKSPNCCDGDTNHVVEKRPNQIHMNYFQSFLREIEGINHTGKLLLGEDLNPQSR